MKHKGLIILGVLAYLGFFILQTPAARVIAWLPLPVQVYGASGSIPTGSADLIQWHEWRFEHVTWVLRLLPLVMGHVEFNLTFHNHDEGTGHTRAGVTLQRRFYLTDPHVRLPSKTLEPMWPMLTNLDGWIVADLDHLSLSNNALDLAGQVTLENVTWKNTPPAPLGDFLVTLETNKDQKILGKIVDRNALLALQGQVTLEPNGLWKLTGSIAPRPNTPPKITQFLTFLGHPDQQGRFPLAFGGSLPRN